MNNKIKYDQFTQKNEDEISINSNDVNRSSDYIRKIKDGFIDLEKAKENQEKLRSNGEKVLTSKQMLQRLLIALAQVKSGNTSDNVLNEIRETIYSLYKAKAVAK